MSLLDRYMISRTVKGISIAFFVVFSLILLIDFVEANNRLSGTDASSFQILKITTLRILSLIEEAIPFIVLFGIIGALYGLNRQSELTVMRASGLSVWRYLRPVFLTSIVLGILWTCLLNPLGSHTLSLHDKELESSGLRNFGGDTLWLREGDEQTQTLIHADSYNPLFQRLNKVTLTQFDLDEEKRPQFRNRYDADEAILLPSGYWQLFNAIENTADLRSKNSQYETIEIATNIKLEDIKSRAPLVPSFWELPDEIKRLNDAGFSATSLNLRWHKLLSLPLSLLAMALIAACVSMRHTRQGGVLILIVSGVTIGFLVFFANSVFTAFGESSALPITVAVWIVPIMTLFLGVTYLSKVEDG